MGSKRHQPRPVICQRCGVTAYRNSPAAKYCLKCSEIASKERHQRNNEKYHRNNKDKIRKMAREAASRNRPSQREGLVEIGKMLSEEQTLSFSRPGSNPLWLVRFYVPFSQSVSKNHIYGYGGHHVYRRRESRAMQDAIGFAAKQALRGVNVVHNKIWIGLHVEKENNRSDAVNAVDLVCDALKVALEIDDRWFCIRYLDWSINKTEPQILIEISQESDEYCINCSACGRILPLERFPKNKNSMHGVARECRECAAGARRIAKQKRLANG